jgi:hypothetical protein
MGGLWGDLRSGQRGPCCHSIPGSASGRGYSASGGTNAMTGNAHREAAGVAFVSRPCPQFRQSSRARSAVRIEGEPCGGGCAASPTSTLGIEARMGRDSERGSMRSTKARPRLCRGNANQNRKSSCLKRKYIVSPAPRASIRSRHDCLVSKRLKSQDQLPICRRDRNDPGAWNSARLALSAFQFTDQGGTRFQNCIGCIHSARLFSVHVLTRINLGRHVCGVESKIMCGRFTQHRGRAAYAEEIGWASDEKSSSVSTADPGQWGPDRIPQYNLTPDSYPDVMHSLEEDGRPAFDTLHWGYRPQWAAEKGIPMAINARIEKASTGKYFRHMWRKGRVIVPADGWYEWTGGKGHKQPW